MAQTKQTFAERARERQRAKAAEAATRTGADEREWSPKDGKYRIRILPPLPVQKDVLDVEGNILLKKGEEDDFFYMTHAYHFFPELGNGGKGLFLWTPRKFNVNGVLVNDPIDDLVTKMFNVANAEKDEELSGFARKIKRKRQYIANALYLEDDQPPKFVILKDSTVKGLLISEICKNMGFPFFFDVQEDYVDKNSLEVDPDRDTYDLVDPSDEGHDFKIVRVKNGANAWDVDYTGSLVVKKGRALSEAELAILENERVDLRNHVEYCTYEQAKAAAVEYADKIGFPLNDEPVTGMKPKTNSQRAASTVKDDDEDEKPVATHKPRPSAPQKEEEPADEEAFDEDLLDGLD